MRPLTLALLVELVARGLARQGLGDYSFDPHVAAPRLHFPVQGER